MDVWKLILSALTEGDTDRLRTLLKGHEINAPKFGDTQDKPLLHAILYDWLLIARKSNWLSRVRKSSARTIDSESEKILRVLYECGSDANLLDNKGHTPLSISIYPGKSMHHITEQLVNVLGADITKEQSGFDDAVAELDDMPDPDSDSSSSCELLMRLGLKPEEDGRYTRLLFKGGKNRGSAEGYKHMFKKLLEWNLILPDECDAKQNTPLHYVVRVLDCNQDYLFNSRSYEDVRERLTTTLCTKLLDHGVNPLATNANGKTALDVWLKHRKLRTGDTDDVEELLLNSMADARVCHYLEMMDLFAQTDMGMRLDTELIEIIKKNACLEETRGKRFTRQRAIDAILAAEGVAPDDYYYRAYINGEFKMDITIASIQKHVKCLVTG